MKKELSSTDVFFLARELKILEGLRLSKVYQLDDGAFLFQFQENKYLVVHLPGKAYLALAKPETPDKLGGMAAKLRKELGTPKVVRVAQVRSERVICIDFGSQKLFIELFGKGRIVLAAYEPPKSIDTFNITENEFVATMIYSKDNVSKTLATTFGLGGIIAKELCLRSAVEPTAKTSGTIVRTLFQKLHEMLAQNIHAHVVLDNDAVVDATPFAFVSYAHLKNEAMPSFSAALEKAFAVKTVSGREKQLAKIDTKIALQEKNLVALEKCAAEEQRKGEWLYEHYQDVAQFLDAVREAREKDKLSWDDIKKKFRQIKEINPATGDVVVEF